MGSIGTPELIVILVIALVIFGPGKLPEVGKAIGKGINEFKDAISGPKKAVDETKKPLKRQKCTKRQLCFTAAAPVHVQGQLSAKTKSQKARTRFRKAV